MAAAAIDTTLEDSFGYKVASKLLHTDFQPIVGSWTPDDGQGGTIDAQDMIIEGDRFPLQDESFLKLQVYLKAGLKLPANDNEFKLMYPEDLFSVYMKKDEKTPLLYRHMSATLTEIHQNCFNFQKGTMNSMMILAGEIGHFSWETSEGVDRISANLSIITEPNASFSEPHVRDAADDLCNVLEDLAVKAERTRGQCHKVFVELSEFRELTKTDKDKLEILTERTSAVLPGMNDLNKEMRDRADRAYRDLNEMARKQNEEIARIENLSAQKWCYFMPFDGNGHMFADTMIKKQAEFDLARYTREYENIFNSASQDLRNAVMFRERCHNLRNNMEHVSEAIKEAANALNGMMSAFTDLQVGCGSVVTELDLAKGKVSNEVVRRRKAALENLQKAKYTWAKVSDLARRFQEHGALVEKEYDDLAQTPDESPWLELVSANYGGVDVTKYAQVLFNYGDSIRIRTCEPGFKEPWRGQVKTLSILTKLHKSKRMFVCKEYSGSKYLHVLGPNKNISDDHVNDAQQSLVSPMKAPDDAAVKILSIIWGPSEIRSQGAYDYCYGRLNNGGIEWNNSNMGGDTWEGQLKSGVIYYQEGDSDDVKQCTGRENTSTPFSTQSV